MADDSDDPMTPSGDYCAMSAYWQMVEAILSGAEAMRATAGISQQHYSVPGPATPVANLRDLNRGIGPTFPQSPYLPAFPNEGFADYEMRRRHAPLTNIYEDVSGNLAAKPFAKECALDEKEPPDLQKLSENIDGQGHSLHVFAKDTFKAGLDKGIDWILIDYTKVPQGVTLADERNMGARPYWVRIPAERMLAPYSAFVGGKEVIYYARIYEPATLRSGYGETFVERVRELSRLPIVDAFGEVIDFEPAIWKLWEKVEAQDDKGKKQVTWVLKAEGPITIGVIPLVPFVPVGRLGMSWKVTPAFANIAHMQVEHFQQESNLKTIKELTAFPMLAGNGVTPPTDAAGNTVTVPVGPRAVLFAPMGADGRFGNWTFIEPTAASLTFLQTDMEKLGDRMLSAGRQPLAAANLTVYTSANLSLKASSEVQGWALLLQDALEQAWKITCQWLKQDRMPVVFVHKDFAPDLEDGKNGEILLKAAGQGVISNQECAAGLKRFNYLPEDFDWKKDQQQAAEEQQGEQLNPEKMIDPVTGAPVVVTPQHGTLNPPPQPPKPSIN